MASLTVPEMIGLESLALHALVGGDHRDPRFADGAKEPALQSLMYLLFGRRVMDAAEGPIQHVGAAAYDGRMRISVRLDASQRRLALALIAWARSGGVDIALIEKRDSIEALQQSLAADANDVETPHLVSPDPPVDPSPPVRVILHRAEVLHLLRMHRHLFGVAWRRSTRTRLVGQEKLAPAYWALYCALRKEAAREALELTLPAACWSRLRILYPVELWRDAIVASSEEHEVCDLVEDMLRDKLLQKLMMAF